MSDFNEIINDLLDKFNKINKLTIEAKEDIDEYLNKKEHNKNTRNEVKDKLLKVFDTLNEQINDTKSKFSNLNECNLDDNKENELTEEDVTVKDHELNETEINGKTYIKVVDINKLLDKPRLDENNDIVENKNQSIIILSSSDDETVKNAPSKSTNSRKIPSILSKSKVKNVLKEKDKKPDDEQLKPYLKSRPFVKLVRIPNDELKKRFKKHEENSKTNDTDSDGSVVFEPRKTRRALKKKQNDSNDESDTSLKRNKVKRKPTRMKSKPTELSDESDENEKNKNDCDDDIEKETKNKKKHSSDDEIDSTINKKKSEKRYNKSKETEEENIILNGEENEKESSKDLGNQEIVEEMSVNLENTEKDDETDKDIEKEDNSEINKKGSEKKVTEEKQKESQSDEDMFNDVDNNKSSSEDESSKRKNKSSDSDTKFQEDDKNSDDSDDSDFASFIKKKKLTTRSCKVQNKILNESDEDKSTDKAVKLDSDHENSNEEDEKENSKKKRRRIKSNDSSDSDERVNTRKKIKKIISKVSLSKSTKQATADERARKERILEKQKKYNQIYESSDLTSSKVEKLVLDVDEKTEKPLVEVSKHIVSKLKPHQASGVQFMWDACFESSERAKNSSGSGCILAHCMGLGKTLQVIALVDTLLEAYESTNVRKVLIVCPLSTVLNWKNEFQNWLDGNENYEIYELVSIKAQNAERSLYVKEWHNNGGVMIISYAMLRNLSNDKNKKIGKKYRNIFIEGLVDPGPDLVVCDEGHLLKNEKTSLSMAMNKMKTLRRIVLTGTPLQNNLKEYYCMVQFVKPNLLGTYKEYLNRFVNPITNGQYTDSTTYDIDIMRKRSHVLHKLLDGIVQRRDYSVLKNYLPPKFEYVLFITLSDIQKKLYSYYMDHFARKSDDGRTSYLFKDFQHFSRICIHPLVLSFKANEEQNYKSDDEESVGSLKNFIDDKSDDCSTSSDESSSSNSDKIVKKRSTRANKVDSDIEDSNDGLIKKEWWQEICNDDDLDNIASSTKLLLLFEILKECEQIGDKVLIFSQSLYALNCIEHFLAKIDEATQNDNTDEKTCGFTGSWQPGVDYFRLDGSTNCNLRNEFCKNFNKPNNTRARLFLLSTRAGGLGINLVGANRVILFDVSWNPSTDVQSIYRVYRFGQLKPSYIYRFVTYGTMEMKIYERQVTKQAISKRVIDEQQIDRHYNQSDLAELYKFDIPNINERPIPLVPKDLFLAELLKSHKEMIYKYHEHQSLLENKEEETLNEAERKAAWDEFENEKVTRNTSLTIIGKFNLSTVQEMLKRIILKDNPTWNYNQIVSIIPQLVQQIQTQLATGDFSLYNRVAGEVASLQEEYKKKIQMQQYQMSMNNLIRQQQQMNSQNLTPHHFQQLFQSFLNQSTNNTSTSNDVIELN